MPGKTARKAKAKATVKGRIVLDTGPLLDLIIVSLGLTGSCKEDMNTMIRLRELERRLNSLKALLEDVKPASLWPVFTEATHLLNSRCNLSKRRDYPEKLRELRHTLQSIEEINITMHESLGHLNPDQDPDLADAALIAASTRSKLYHFITNDSALKGRLRSRGAHAITLWELLSLISTVP